MSLRSRLSSIYGEALPSSPAPETDLTSHIEGQWVDTEDGRLLQIERHYPLEYRHGNVTLRELRDLELRELDLLAGQSICVSDCKDLLFLDTETTGLAGGTGTHVFLIGIGFFSEDAFRVVQLFLPELGHEPALLRQLGHVLGEEARASKLVTFNGKCYDINLLETRFIIHRIPFALSSLPHLDLLYPARQVWRGCFADCGLQTLEHRVLGFARNGDIPGYQIPQAYFAYLRTGRFPMLHQILRHNRLDILTLLSLSTVLIRGLNRPEPAWFPCPIAVARILEARGETSRARRILEAALGKAEWLVKRGEILTTLGLLAKKEKDFPAALRYFKDAFGESNRPQLEAYEEAAKILEHQLGDFRRALTIVEQGLRNYSESEALAHRHHRLKCRISGRRWY